MTDCLVEKQFLQNIRKFSARTLHYIFEANAALIFDSSRPLGRIDSLSLVENDHYITLPAILLVSTSQRHDKILKSRDAIQS